MQYDHILIRYGELALKGKNAKQFILKLHDNIHQKVKEFDGVKVMRTQGRMFVLLNGNPPEPIIEKLQNVFGIHSLSLAIRVENDVEEMKEAALYALKREPNVKTFKMSVRRTKKDFPKHSGEMNHILGSHLLTNTEDITVDVHDPDLEIKVEIRREATYITSGAIKCRGGLPVGTS